MNTKQNKKSEDFYIECSNCHICSNKLSAKELELIEDGQYMAEMCQICGCNIVVYDCNILS